jgi:hypothetical protein
MSEAAQTVSLEGEEMNEYIRGRFPLAHTPGHVEDEYGRICTEKHK